MAARLLKGEAEQSVEGAASDEEGGRLLVQAAMVEESERVVQQRDDGDGHFSGHSFRNFWRI